MPRSLARVTIATSVLMLLAACGSSSSSPAEPGSAGGQFPMTVENCGAEVTFDQAPERVVLLKSASVPYLAELGVLDKVIARAGAYPTDYYDAETQAALDEIPLLTDKTDTTGHLQISTEVVISQEPDLVIGETDNLNRDTLGAVGIPVLEEPGLCGEGLADPGFDDVSDQMNFYGKVFNRPAEAKAAVASLEERLATVETSGDRTAAVLYPTVGGGVTYAYGTRSMAQPQLEIAGFTNVFGDVHERVFEVTLEKLIGLDPDVLVLLYTDGDPDAVSKAITELPGAEKLTAVRNGDVMPQLFNFTEPPSPLAVTGLERIEERFAQ